MKIYFPYHASEEDIGKVKRNETYLVEPAVIKWPYFSVDKDYSCRLLLGIYFPKSKSATCPIFEDLHDIESLFDDFGCRNASEMTDKEVLVFSVYNRITGIVSRD